MEFSFTIEEKPKPVLSVTLYTNHMAAFAPDKFPDCIWKADVSLSSVKMDKNELGKFLNKHLNPALSNLFYLALKDQELG